MPQKGYIDNNAWCHVYGMMSHANIFHLATNVFCLCTLKNKIKVVPAVLISFLCSFLPTWYTSPTMGFSGVIFSILGIEWGEIGKFKGMCKMLLPVIALTLLVPNMNALLHLYSLMGGYLFAYINYYENRRESEQG